MKTKCGYKKSNRILNEQGQAMFEGLVFMMAFVVLTVYVFDTFTAIHTGIVNSIGARGYLFETLQHRANIRYLRNVNEDTVGSKQDFLSDHSRFHTVNDEDQPYTDTNSIKAPGRRLTQVKDATLREFQNPGQLNGQNKTAVIYVKEGYGICLDAKCEPGG